MMAVAAPVKTVFFIIIYPSEKYLQNKKRQMLAEKHRRPNLAPFPIIQAYRESIFG
jgi:hypothetical protein